MRRKLILAVLILLAFVLQGTVFQTLSIASIVPNLLLILTVSFGFMRGKKEGMFVGFFCGLLIDIFYGSMIGFYALIYMYIGFCKGFLYKIFFDEDVKVPMVLVAGSDIAYGVLVYGLQFMLRGRLDFFSYLQHIILPEMVFGYSLLNPSIAALKPSSPDGHPPTVIVPLMLSGSEKSASETSSPPPLDPPQAASPIVMVVAITHAKPFLIIFLFFIH